MRSCALALMVLALMPLKLAAEEIVLTTLKSGKIAVKAPDGDAFKPLSEGEAIVKGSWIMTLGNTDATLTFYKTDRKAGDSNSTLQIGSYTKLKIENFDAAKEKVTTEIKASVGHIISSVDPDETKGNDYTVETPQITAAVKGTITESRINFIMTQTRVIRGLVLATSGQRAMTLGANQRTTATNWSMTPSIDSRLIGAQNPMLFTGGSPAERAFILSAGWVTTSADPRTGNTNQQDFRNATNQSLSASQQLQEPNYWSWVGMMGVWVLVLNFPPPPGVIPPPPPPPPSDPPPP